MSASGGASFWPCRRTVSCNPDTGVCFCKEPDARGGPDGNGKAVSVQPEWCRALSVQQQSVLLLATRGPDGKGKAHPCKRVHVAYRGSVLVAAKYGRGLYWGERADKFMSLDEFAYDGSWADAVYGFFQDYDSLPHHYLNHLMHGVQILGYKHPDRRFSSRWLAFYLRMVDNEHLKPETEEEMDRRLGDWDREYWGDEPDPERFPNCPPPGAPARREGSGSETQTPHAGEAVLADGCEPEGKK